MSTTPVKYNYLTQRDYDAVAGPDWPSFVDFQKHINVPDFVYDEIDQMLAAPVLFEHPAFCVLPFYGWEYPLDTACCLLPKKYDLSKIQKDMLNGQRPESCAKCWNLEDRGIKSDRQLKNETVDFYLDKNIQDLFENCQQTKQDLMHYKIDTSNTCNAACVTCDSGSSSHWGELLRKNKQTYRRNWQILPQSIDQKIDYKTARLVNFRGGEPLLSKTNFHILEQLVSAGNTECFISFQTNGSVTPTSDQEMLLKNFKNLNFSLSIDGIGPVFEYLRYPLKWKDIEKTMAWCRQRNIDISVSYTVSNLNVFYHNQTLSWFKSNSIPFLMNLVYDPVWFAPSVLPDQIKSRIDFDFLPCDNNKELCDLFKEKISLQDKWKGIQMKDYLPELSSLLD
jgi:hypothetical protein